MFFVQGRVPVPTRWSMETGDVISREQQDKFAEIRPYRDHEIRPVLERLMEEREFLDSMAAFQSRRLARWLPGLLRFLISRRLRRFIASVDDVQSMQQVVALYMEKTVRTTTWGLSQTGLENLRPDQSYVFVSNHRDIVMDPAFTNLLLHRAGFTTVQIGVGDNLLTKPFVADLMRVNKSFIVHRSLKGRELLLALRLLSEYIHHCMEVSENVWIAQREGRAKDGIDRTDPALLKMLAMGKRKMPLHQSLAHLHIVPVAISYEIDPCDSLKARELHQIKTIGSFPRTEAGDLRSIVKGMTGFKGKVHVAFGEELRCEADDAELAAAAIDRQIIRNYRLYETNYRALEILLEEGALESRELAQLVAGREVDSRSRELFDRRLAEVHGELREVLLFGYANPVISQFERAAGGN